MKTFLTTGNEQEKKNIEQLSAKIMNKRFDKTHYRKQSAVFYVV